MQVTIAPSVVNAKISSEPKAERAQDAYGLLLLVADIYISKSRDNFHITSTKSEAFAALGYMWKSWSGHPHLNAEPTQGQGYDTRLHSLVKIPIVM
ncbi:hypothetical protein EMCRGX_G014661 [Ephydatia muelleri]